MPSKKTAPRAEYATKPVTPLMQEYADWITAQTGYPVDARSVFLSSALRTTFQAERRTEKQAALDSITVTPTRTRRRGSTVTARGHDGKAAVIAQQRHVEVTER